MDAEEARARTGQAMLGLLDGIDEDYVAACEDLERAVHKLIDVMAANGVDKRTQASGIAGVIGGAIASIIYE